MNYRKFLKNQKTIVIKIGSTSVISPDGTINIEKLNQLTNVLSTLRKDGKNILLVSSGAIAAGAYELGFKERPRDVLGQQVTASIGQVSLISEYKKHFLNYNQKISQILVTRDVFKNKSRSLNFKNSLLKMFELGLIPIINENDTIAFDDKMEACDNDTLAAIICQLIEGDLLILLSDIDGLYTKNPNIDKSATLISYIDKIDSYVENLASSPSSNLGTGGMVTKISAAKICMYSGIHMLICSGKDPNIIFDALDGKEIGTLFYAK